MEAINYQQSCAIAIKMLMEHTSKKSAITNKKIRNWLETHIGQKTHAKAIRQMIKDLRQVHYIPICSSSTAGYWIAEDINELEKCIESLQTRVSEQIATIRALQNITL